MLAAATALVLAAPDSQAQQQRKKGPAPVAKEATQGTPQDIRREQQPGARESVQADVSARTVSVTSSFNGTEIVIFGAVDNSQQPSAESGYYDVVIVVEGVPGRVVARRKNNVAGLWLNTSSATFDAVPSYYAVASTRPLDEIASEEFRASHGIGFQHLRMMPAFGQAQALSSEDLKEFREAVIRLKQKDGLYVQDPYSVAFIGRSLFRSAIELPANVTVGPFTTRVFLFREEQAAQPVLRAPVAGARGAGAAPASVRLRLSDAVRLRDGGHRRRRRPAGLHRVPQVGALRLRARSGTSPPHATCSQGFMSVPGWGRRGYFARKTVRPGATFI